MQYAASCQSQKRGSFHRTQVVVAEPARAAFRADVEQVLVPTLRPSDIAIPDNLAAHKGSEARAAIEAARAALLYFPPYRPDCNPIENALAKLKDVLRKTAARTIGSLGNAIRHASTIHAAGMLQPHHRRSL